MAHQLNGGFNLQQAINNKPHTDIEKKRFNNNITATGQPPQSPDNSTPNYGVPSQTQTLTLNSQNSASQLPAPTEYTSEILPHTKLSLNLSKIPPLMTKKYHRPR